MNNAGERKQERSQGKLLPEQRGGGRLGLAVDIDQAFPALALLVVRKRCRGGHRRDDEIEALEKRRPLAPQRRALLASKVSVRTREVQNIDTSSLRKRKVTVVDTNVRRVLARER